MNGLAKLMRSQMRVGRGLTGLSALWIVACTPIERLEARLEFRRQLSTDEAGAVVLINEFDVEPEDVQRFLTQWRQIAAVMARQPGYVSARLHRQSDSDGRRHWLNYAVWRSAADLKRALQTKEFARMAKGLPASATPRLFRFEGAPVDELAHESQVQCARM
jgi:quinol monooxygenase YgiN